MALELLSLTHFNESVQTDNIIWIVHHKKKKNVHGSAKMAFYEQKNVLVKIYER